MNKIFNYLFCPNWKKIYIQKSFENVISTYNGVKIVNSDTKRLHVCALEYSDVREKYRIRIIAGLNTTESDAYINCLKKQVELEKNIDI